MLNLLASFKENPPFALTYNDQLQMQILKQAKPQRMLHSPFCFDWTIFFLVFSFVLKWAFSVFPHANHCKLVCSRIIVVFSELNTGDDKFRS